MDLTVRDVVLMDVTVRDVNVRDVTPNSSQALIRTP